MGIAEDAQRGSGSHRAHAEIHARSAERSHLVGGAMQVLFGEAVNADFADAQIAAQIEELEAWKDARGVALALRLAPRLRPSPVTVRYEPYVLRQPPEAEIIRR